MRTCKWWTGIAAQRRRRAISTTRLCQGYTMAKPLKHKSESPMEMARAGDLVDTEPENVRQIPIKTRYSGAELLEQPRLNKGTAFSREERQQFGLSGLLPFQVHTIEQQVERAYDQYKSRSTNLLKNTFLSSMEHQNQVLFYRLLRQHLKEMLPVIYTPTEGEAIKNYSRLWRKPSGCFLSAPEVDQMEEMLKCRGGADDIDLIVVSDGGAILGIGDQGVGGIGISTAKLTLYTLLAGIDPNRVLPIVLDVGTDNESLRKDPLYLGWNHDRLKGKEYDAIIDKFVPLIGKLFPKALLHLEDFNLENSRRILDKYRGQRAIFDDDVQGTGAVTLGAIMAACKVAGSRLKNQRIVIYGAGTAGTGIADQLRDACILEGTTKEDAIRQIWCVDRHGLLFENMGPNLTPAQAQYARPNDEKDHFTKGEQVGLLDVIKAVKPTVLIGCSTHPKSFTEECIVEMARHVERPIILPLSNPTELHECDPRDALKWTDGKGLLATGSPFPPAEVNGKTITIAECNNALVYPGFGLGCIISQATHLTDEMIVQGVHALAKLSPTLRDPTAALLPDVDEIEEVSVKIATAVAMQAQKEGVARIDLGQDPDQLEKVVRASMWKPQYRPLERI